MSSTAQSQMYKSVPRGQKPYLSWALAYIFFFFFKNFSFLQIDLILRIIVECWLGRWRERRLQSTKVGEGKAGGNICSVTL